MEHHVCSFLEVLTHVSTFATTIESQCFKKLYMLTLYLIFEYLSKYMTGTKTIPGTT
jgi:hypothetical protein